MNKEQRWILARYLIIEKEIIGKHGKNTNLGIRSRGWSKKPSKPGERIGTKEIPCFSSKLWSMLTAVRNVS